MRPDEYEKFDGLGLAALVERRQAQPIELVEAAIALIESRNAALNAVVHTMYEKARATAEGLQTGDAPKSGDAAPAADAPFFGVPFLVKDAGAAVAGEPLTASCRLLEHNVPERDSELVRRLRAAGLVIVAQTNTPELAAAAVTESKMRGPARNPWDTGRTPGGSSGGSAAAVTAGMTPLAHGADGGGSLRIPGSCCGLFALKPSRGRNPAAADDETWFGLAQEHVLTRSVRDSAALLDAATGGGVPNRTPPPVRPFGEEVGADPGRLRIGFAFGSLFGRDTHPDCRAAVADAVELCRRLGHEAVEWFPPFPATDTRRAFLALVIAGLAASVTQAERLVGREATGDDLEPGTWQLVRAGRDLPAAGLAAARRRVRATARAVAAAMDVEGCDVLLTSTLAYPPLEVGAPGMGPDQWAAVRELDEGPDPARLLELVDVYADRDTQFVGNTALFNATGQPAMSVPLFWNDGGLPIGVQFAGRYGDEASLFRLAGQLEQACPWFDCRPPRREAEAPVR